MNIRFHVEPVTAELVRCRHLFVNLYFIGTPKRWVLVDGGLPGSNKHVVNAAEGQFGPDNPPEAIVLTHGHFDHVGLFPEIFSVWDVPVFAHSLELPHLRGERDYPKPTPLIRDGAMAWASVLYPRSAIDLGERVRELPVDGGVPGLPEWRWIHTPGHTAGHVSLFRDADRALVAGDAFVTVRQESLLRVALQRREIHGPPAYFTPDWAAARQSIAALAALRPAIAATGHGTPMPGDELDLEYFALQLHRA